MRGLRWGAWFASLAGGRGSLRRGLVQGAGAGVALQGLNLLLGFGSGILAARLLGPSGLGRYAYALALVGLLSIPAALGLPATLVRFLAIYGKGGEWRLARGLLRRSNQLVGGAGLALAVALVGMAASYTGGTQALTFWLAAPLVPLLAWTNLRQRALQGLHHPVAAQLPEQVIKHAAFLALGALLLGMGWGMARQPQGLMAVWVVASTLAFGAGALLLKRLAPAALRVADPVYDTGRWLRTALPLLAAGSAGIVYSSTDIILLGLFRPAAEVGLYQVAVRTAALLVVFLTAANWVLAPWFASLHAEGERGRLQGMVTRATRAVFLPSLVVYAVFVFAGRELLALFFGADYAHAWGVLLILGGARLVDVAAGPVINLMAMTGGQRALAAVIAVAALGNVLGCWLLIGRYGMYGAAISTALAMAATNVALAVLVRRRIGIRTTVFG